MKTVNAIIKYLKRSPQLPPGLTRNQAIRTIWDIFRAGYIDTHDLAYGASDIMDTFAWGCDTARNGDFWYLLHLQYQRDRNRGTLPYRNGSSN